MKVFYSEECEKYHQEGHPEHPHRTSKAFKHLRGKYDFIEPEPVTDDDLLLAHAKELVNSVRHANFFDSDTPNLHKIFDYAKLAAGGATAAMNAASSDENAFSLMRPPGHHAGKNFLGGFCYFNNIAVAVKLALKKNDKIAIVDIDGHHGNGTQDIFLGDKNVLFVSLHQKNAFPMSGFISSKNCLNYPLAPSTRSEVYLDILDKALDNVTDFDPDMIAVSAGFDTYKLDPLLELEIDKDAYFEIAAMISSLKKPVFAVLEGGYSSDLPECIENFLHGLED